TVKGREVADDFARKGLDATRSLVEAGDRLVATLEERSSTAAEVLSSTKDKLESDISGILERLDHSNAMLSGVLETAGENLARVETNLARSAGEFRTAVDRAVDETGTATGTISEQ